MYYFTLVCQLLFKYMLYVFVVKSIMIFYYMTVIVNQYFIIFHNNISLILCFTLLYRTEKLQAVCRCCLLVLYGVLLLNIVLHFDLCQISVYALRAPRQMSFGSLGSPSGNKNYIIIIIIC